MSTLKQQLYQYCLTKLDERVRELKEQITNIQESKHNETKSSAGDKYETGRAMMQMEEDKVNAQLEKTQLMRQQFEQIDPNYVSSTIGMGSIVRTSTRTYFLSIGIGKIRWEGEDYFCLSPASPIGRELWDKKRGTAISFNGKTEKILTIQ